jgi:hypothetical protein
MAAVELDLELGLPAGKAVQDVAPQSFTDKVRLAKILLLCREKHYIGLLQNPDYIGVTTLLYI